MFYFAIVLKTPDKNGLYQIRGWDTQEAETSGAALILVQERAAPYQYDAVLLPGMTEERWTVAFRVNFELAVKNRGTAAQEIVEYTPPPVVVPLKEQANTALQQARMTVYNQFGILGEPTPAAWVAYLKALMAIVSGADTTSTALPIAPGDATP
ncbi:hypothetical protein J3T99_02100 [Acetobacteraceae bacterium B3987]|nr:hypothetical protein [Acetobacteraceae bacterium B3987]